MAITYSEMARWSDWICNFTLEHHGRHKFIEVFAELDTRRNPGLIHPFDIAFSPSEDMYVSAQDTNLVLRVKLQIESDHPAI